jgi:hypothetical protein
MQFRSFFSGGLFLLLAGASRVHQAVEQPSPEPIAVASADARVLGGPDGANPIAVNSGDSDPLDPVAIFKFRHKPVAGATIEQIDKSRAICIAGKHAVFVAVGQSKLVEMPVNADTVHWWYEDGEGGSSTKKQRFNWVVCDRAKDGETTFTYYFIAPKQPTLEHDFQLMQGVWITDPKSGDDVDRALVSIQAHGIGAQTQNTPGIFFSIATQIVNLKKHVSGGGGTSPELVEKADSRFISLNPETAKAQKLPAVIPYKLTDNSLTLLIGDGPFKGKCDLKKMW